MQTKFRNNPLKTCKLRTVGLESVKGAEFGYTRHYADGSPKAHQGIDLAIDNNYKCYAVENGTIVGQNKGANGYGYTLTLQLICPEKPELDGKFVFYAHLSDFKVQVGDCVKAGDYIALTGSTGNAKGMNDVKHGSHLHFELRESPVLGLGLAGRLDPEPFISF